MYSVDFRVLDDPQGLFERMRLATLDARNYMPDWNVVPRRKAKQFIRDYPEHYDCPRSLIRGVFAFGIPKLTDTGGFYWKKTFLRFLGKGDIHLDTPRPINLGPRNYEFDFDEGNVRLYFFGRPRRATYSKNIEGDIGNVSALRKEDVNLDFLIVNEGYHHETTWRKKGVIDYVHTHQDVYLQELRRMGFRGDINMDLLSDSIPGMQHWLRSRQKPPDCNVLSRSQMESRQDRELRMPDVINEEDSSRGSLVGQSYEAQIFDAMHKDKQSDFFS